jgi:glycosyltransferase involved in cell wall biosynthesis
MKKKILFMMLNMNVGGTEKALLNLLSSFPQDKYDISIFMLEKYGEFLNHIPHSIKVEYFTDYESIKSKINQPLHLLAIDLFKKGKLFKCGIYLFYYLLTKVLRDRSAWFKFILKNYPKIEQTYDVAVAYAGPNDFISYFIHHKVKAKKKIQWIHFDVTKIGFNKKFAAKTYRHFEKIYVVSNEGKEKLVSLLPSLHPKIEVFKNIISPSLIYKQADSGKSFGDNFEGIKILTIGRLSFEKGQDLAIEALAKLRQDGFNVRWYCLGEGNSRKRYEEMIKEHNIVDHFILLGLDANPYSYLQECDIYV